VTMVKSTHRYRRWIVLLVLVGLGVAAAFYWTESREDKPSYRQVSVTRGDLELTILSTGVVQPQNRLEIKPPIAGRADQVLVVEGQKVTKGQVMAWMSSTERAALIDAARARGPEEVKRWEEIYRPTPVLAPINGTVILRNIEPGQTFTGNDAVFVMSDRLIVMAQVDETDIAQIRLHQRAKIVLDAYPDQPFTGQVDLIAYDATTVNNVTTYNVEVLPDKVPDFMRSGMTANVSFVAARHPGVLLIPADAVKSRAGHTYVLTPPKKPNGAPVEKEVKIGLSDGKRVEVLEGVTEGQPLLVLRIQTGANAGGSNPFSPFGRRH
jgi:membrane fusion protein, macrolide-specific efflux system